MTVLALPTTYIISLILLTALVSWLVVHTKHRTKLIIFYIAMSFFLYVSATGILSYPRPVDREFFQRDSELKVRVIFYQVNPPNDIIYLYKFPGEVLPRYYIEDYSDELLEQLLNADKQAQGEGGRLMRRDPFFNGLETDKPKFYSDPQPMFLPPKENLYQPPTLRGT